MSSYLTPEHYKIAKENGITEGALYHRFYEYGWDLEKAITKPLKKSADPDSRYAKWRELAKENGISYSRFYERVKRQGWDYERAATQKLMSQQEAAIKAARSRHRVRLTYVTEEQYQQAQELGIPRSLVRQRINKLKWTTEEAITTPVKKVKR